ncbi:MAG: hypothetical protein AAGL17_18870 [Cyanobacteria bacterium J06576_12]
MTKPTTDKFYSISSAAAAIGKSESQVKAYKKLVLSTFKKDLEKVQASNGSLTEYGLQQLKMAGRFYAKSNHEGYKKAVFQANPDLEYCLADDQIAGSPKPESASVYSSGSLVQVKQTNQANQLVTFDKSSAAGAISEIKQQGMASAQQLGNVFSSYAQTRVQQAFHEIDATVEAYKANALIDMGLTSTEVTQQND